MGEHRLIHFLKTQSLKKLRLIGQCKNPLRPQESRLFQTGLHQLCTNAFVPILLLDSQGPDFRQIVPADVEGADAYDFAIPYKDKKISKMVIEFAQGPGRIPPRGA